MTSKEIEGIPRKEKARILVSFFIGTIVSLGFISVVEKYAVLRLASVAIIIIFTMLVFLIPRFSSFLGPSGLEGIMFGAGCAMILGATDVTTRIVAAIVTLMVLGRFVRDLIGKAVQKTPQA